ncbi:class I SAM-dependent methyltransferase [Actinophytocola gossypii]|uniref:Methyltransferase domain-containing protein n=1 Tax=Actinophytocola gossypii TaxID=2812003 RepID=A0ABT2JJY7_9PSEU|nr:methyltransferase [Actinophytocola gossypii]MCT2588192.1 methyltransferase domain-containing protein [Actinophytocola gossypii]
MAHTHDGIDWDERLTALRRADEVSAAVDRRVAERLVGMLASRAEPPVVVDVGSGAGGMGAAFAAVLAERGGGRVVLADAVDALLSAASEHVRAVAGERVRVDAVSVDAADEGLASVLPSADLVWASRVVHHLPDQQRAINRLATTLAPGGWLALSEGGLRTECLPWDVGLGEPGLGDRLTAAGNAWFARMRAEMPGAVRLPVGWTRALDGAGLVDTSSFSYLTDLPAPADELVRLSVVDWLNRVSSAAEEYLDEPDRAVVRRLLDPADEAYVARRDDVFLLSATTVHLGRRSA